MLVRLALVPSPLDANRQHHVVPWKSVELVVLHDLYDIFARMTKNVQSFNLWIHPFLPRFPRIFFQFSIDNCLIRLR